MAENGYYNKGADLVHDEDPFNFLRLETDVKNVDDGTRSLKLLKVFTISQPNGDLLSPLNDPGEEELDYTVRKWRPTTPTSTKPRSRRSSCDIELGDYSDGEWTFNRRYAASNASKSRSRRNSGDDDCEPEDERRPSNESKPASEEKGKPEVGFIDDSIFRKRMTIAGGFLDIALFTSNCEQLKSLLEIEQHDTFYYPVLGLLIASMALQAVCGMTLFMLGFLIIKDKADKHRGDILNHITFGLIALITVVNIFISSFGVKEAFIRKCNLVMASNDAAAVRSSMNTFF